MEIESWLLAFHKVFDRIDLKCKGEYIERRLGVKIDSLDPEEEFSRPSKALEKLKIGYDKSSPERITDHIKDEDLNEVLNSNKVQSFQDFYTELYEIMRETVEG